MRQNQNHNTTGRSAHPIVGAHTRKHDLERRKPSMTCSSSLPLETAEKIHLVCKGSRKPEGIKRDRQKAVVGRSLGAATDSDLERQEKVNIQSTHLKRFFCGVVSADAPESPAKYAAKLKKETRETATAIGSTVGRCDSIYGCVGDLE